MIGPHQGKELELMLEGKKRFAFFYDVLLPQQSIAEEIIPEMAFLPHVKAGKILRFSEILHSSKVPHPAQYVFFTLNGEEWRVKAFLHMTKECLSGNRPFDDAHEYLVGRLLDYSEADIEDFIAHRKRRSTI